MRASEMRNPPTSKPKTAARNQLRISAPEKPQASSSSAPPARTDDVVKAAQHAGELAAAEVVEVERCSMMALMPLGRSAGSGTMP